MKNACLLIFLFCLSVFAQAKPTQQETVQDLRWRLLGPLRAGWSSCAEGIPDEPNTFYFGGVDGGVWKTTDSGVIWKPLADQAPFSSVGALGLAPGNPPVIYVGTGHVDTRYDVMDGTGIFKTEDDGKTWTPLGLTDTRHIGRILVDPRDPKIILVAALGHLFGPNAERGIFRSENGGLTWTKVLFVDENTGAVDLASDPAIPDVVYAALWQVRQYPWLSYFQPQDGTGSGIWKSIDGGKTWTQTSRKGLPDVPLSRIGLAVAPTTHGQRVYASVYAEKDAGFYRSDDAGDSWQLMNRDSALASTYFARVTTDPENPDTVWAMGIALRKSTDGGKTFVITKGAPGGDDYHFLWINPNYPDHRILASDQGTTVTVNDGKTWSPWYNQATGQFYRLSADNRFPYWIYSGQQDSGTVGAASQSDYGQLTFRDWHPVGGDERDTDIPDPEDPNIVYGSGLGGRLSKWDMRNGRVTNVSPWPVSSYAKRPGTVKYRYTWFTPIAISSRDTHPMYQGAQVLFRSVNKGQSWEIISPDLTGPDPNATDCDGDVPESRATACGYGTIFSIAPSPERDGVIWVGTDNGRVQLTLDDGKTWNNVTPTAVSDWSNIASIDASPTDSSAAYIAVDRHRMDDRQPYIYRTHDFGKTWITITSGIPKDSWVNVVRQDPIRRGLLYAGTRTGVFVSYDDGHQWHPLQFNLPRTSVNDLLVHKNDLIAATQGRAIWILDDVTALRHLNPDSLDSEPVLVPPVRAIRMAKNENRDTPLPPEVPATPNPPIGAVLDYYLPEQPSEPIALEILNEQGEVVRRFESDEKPERPKVDLYFAEEWIQPWSALPARKGQNRFVWDLRHARPQSPGYEYSIAAVFDQDTPIVPQGILVVPGKYLVRLIVDEKNYDRPLWIEPDPRIRIKPENLEAQLLFYREVTATLAAASEKKEAAEKREKELAASNEGKDANIPEVADAQKERKALTDFISALNALISLVIDLENSDGPPTDGQRQLYAEYKTTLEASTK